MSANSSGHPMFDRVCHAVNLVNFIVLIITGMLIHFPQAGLNMNVIRNLHFIFAFILIMNGMIRLYWSFFGKEGDWKDFLFTKADLKNLFPQIKYYLFMGKHPHTRKYNPPQILAYFCLFLMTLAIIATGLMLLYPQTFLFFFTLGTIRLFHYLLTWAFIIIILIHIYLACSEAPDEFLLMFFGIDKHKKES